MRSKRKKQIRMGDIQNDCYRSYITTNLCREILYTDHANGKSRGCI